MRKSLIATSFQNFNLFLPPAATIFSRFAQTSHNFMPWIHQPPARLLRPKSSFYQPSISWETARFWFQRAKLRSWRKKLNLGKIFFYSPSVWSLTICITTFHILKTGFFFETGINFHRAPTLYYWVLSISGNDSESRAEKNYAFCFDSLSVCGPWRTQVGWLRGLCRSEERIVLKLWPKKKLKAKRWERRIGW